MKTSGTQTLSKRPINLRLSEWNIEQARQFTGNLSATVDALLADYVARESAARQARQQHREAICDALNEFNGTHGSFADEHSTL